MASVLDYSRFYNQQAANAFAPLNQYAQQRTALMLAERERERAEALRREDIARATEEQRRAERIRAEELAAGREFQTQRDASSQAFTQDWGREQMQSRFAREDQLRSEMVEQNTGIYLMLEDRRRQALTRARIQGIDAALADPMIQAKIQGNKTARNIIRNNPDVPVAQKLSQLPTEIRAEIEMFANDFAMSSDEMAFIGQQMGQIPINTLDFSRIFPEDPGGGSDGEGRGGGSDGITDYDFLGAGTVSDGEEEEDREPYTEENPAPSREEALPGEYYKSEDGRVLIRSRTMGELVETGVEGTKDTLRAGRDLGRRVINPFEAWITQSGGYDPNAPVLAEQAFSALHRRATDFGENRLAPFFSSMMSSMMTPAPAPMVNQSRMSAQPYQVDPSYGQPSGVGGWITDQSRMMPPMVTPRPAVQNPNEIPIDHRLIPFQ